MSRAKLSQEIVSIAMIIGIVIIYIIFRFQGGGLAAVDGKSMEPLLHTGDLVVIIKKKDVREGDIIVFKSGDRYIIHRVIYVYENHGYKCYVTKGDNNISPDSGDPRRCPPVYGFNIAGYPEDVVLGVVVSIRGAPVKVPYIGGVTLLVRG
ncbi:MAG: signal peptidase I [Acidilobaceae archaeon]